MSDWFPVRLALVMALVAGAVFALSACGGDSTRLGKRVIPLGQPVPKGGGRYMVGEPYDIAGVRYTPREDPKYDRTGQASWYGELFHGRYTANGEIYDMDRLSAAHPTLPLPVYAQVTNLQNGRTIVVRVNDRGPFKKDRIIDLSRRSAEILGFRRSGTAHVRVRYLRRAPLNGDDSYERQFLAASGYQRYAAGPQAVPPSMDPLTVASLPARGGPPPLPDRATKARTALAALPQPAPSPTPAPAPVPRPIAVTTTAARAELQGSQETTGSTGMVTQPAPYLVAPGGGPAIQAGSFRNKENAERARVVLSGIGPVNVDEVSVAGDTYYRVRVGPFSDGIAAAAALPQVTEAGYQGAKIILRN